MNVALESFSRQVKSRLYPLSVLETVLEWLVERLPRRLILVEFKSSHDVAVISESKGEYKATGNSPSFEMVFSIGVPQCGWYYLEAALSRNNGNRETSIRADMRGKAHESISITIPTNLRGTVREIFFLPPNVTALYWLPTAAPGYFSQSPLLIHKISPLESYLRRMHRVIYDLWRFRGSATSTSVGLTWLGAITNLSDAYQRTAILRNNRLNGNDYSAFIVNNDTFQKSEMRILRRQVSQLPLHPLISLIMPVQEPMETFFRESLDSIVNQIYPYWELLLVGDFSASLHVNSIANVYRSKYAQVKIISVKSGIDDLATTFNRALELVQGDFVTRINQHDQIPPCCLLFLAREVNSHPCADFIYTDDDSIDETNKRFDPHFKPDWNQVMFFSHNYLTSLTLCRKAIAVDIGGYRSSLEGAEDYDFYLRYLRDIPASNIKHIPRVLYHRRIASQPMQLIGFPISADSCGRSAHQSGKRALEDYFEGDRTIIEDGPTLGTYHVKHPLPMHPPLVSIIIPTRDNVEILKNCIESIQQKTKYANWEILIVDNQSIQSETHAYFKQIESDKRFKVIHYDKPFNYSALNNFAVPYAHGEILALLNNDVEVISFEWLSEMVSYAVRPEIGAVGAKLLYSNGSVQHAGVILGLGGVAGHAHKHLKGDDPGYCHRAIVAQNLSAVTGACLVVRKCCYLQVGGLNETDLKIALNDIDFCLKLLVAGYSNVFTPYARLFHHESISRGHDDTPEKHAVFLQEFGYMKQTWGARLQRDPAYNPNLTLEFENFSLSNRLIKVSSGPAKLRVQG